MHMHHWCKPFSFIRFLANNRGKGPSTERQMWRFVLHTWSKMGRAGGREEVQCIIRRLLLFCPPHSWGVGCRGTYSPRQVFTAARTQGAELDMFLSLRPVHVLQLIMFASGVGMGWNGGCFVACLWPPSSCRSMPNVCQTVGQTDEING